MKIRTRVIPLAALFAAQLMIAPAVHAADSDRITGTWSVIAVDNVSRNGERSGLYGPHPHGVVMFDTDGHYSLQIMSDGRPRFSANDKSKGTPEEYKAAVQGSNCHFGRYVVNEANHSVTLHVEHATFSNWEGADLTWPISFKGKDLTFTIPHPTTGGPDVVGEVVVRRPAK